MAVKDIKKVLRKLEYGVYVVSMGKGNEGNAFTAVHTAGEVQLRARTGLGLVALVDGTNVAGFTLPAVGQPEGVRWVPLNGAGTAIEEAAAKLK